MSAGRTRKPNWVTWSRKEMCTEAPAGASSELMGAAEADVSEQKEGREVLSIQHTESAVLVL